MMGVDEDIDNSLPQWHNDSAAKGTCLGPLNVESANFELILP